MRFAPKGVKLQFDNVRFRKSGQAAILALKNTRNVDIFGQIAPFRRTSNVARGLIDENGSLPYKPRQLSAMTRSDRGGSFGLRNGPLWAGQHRRTTLIYQANCPLVRQIVCGERPVKR